MSDYMFMLESHLTAPQRRIVSIVQAAADSASVNLYLSGGAIRDMLGGFPIREMEFTVEGQALKFAQAIAKSSTAKITRTDENARVATLRFPGGAQCRISLARVEEFLKPGAKPKIQPATIYEHLRGRDFTVNALALSLNPASRGLLVDPTNGLADLERRELRAVSNYSLMNDPVRLLRLVRLRTQLGFTVDERTWQQYQNARAAGLEKAIAPRSLYDELCLIGADANAAEIVQALSEEDLLEQFCPALGDARHKLSPAGFQKLQKARTSVPFGAPLEIDDVSLFLLVLTEKLTVPERAALVAGTKMQKAEVDAWQKLPTRARRRERMLTSPKLQKPSALYNYLSSVPGEEIIWLYMDTGKRLVHDRIKNYFQKYLVTAIEITDADVAEHFGVDSSSPKFAKFREQFLAGRLDGKIRKKIPPPVPEPAPIPNPRRGRFARSARAL